MMQSRFRRWTGFAIFTFLVFYYIPDAHGSGFAIYTHGASALGQANAVIASIDDPTAIFFNPALISKLEGTQIEAGTTLIFPSRKFRSDLTGDTYETESAVFYPGTIFITHKYNEKTGFGLGVFNPFGLGTDWDDNWEGRYIATNSEMQTFNINPVVSYQLTPNVSFAAGLDFLMLDTTLEKKINLSAFGLPDAGQRFDGDGDGIGYNLGMLFGINKDISAGLSYRSEVKIDIDGNAAFDLPSAALSTTFPDTGGKTDITFPQQVHAGIAYKGVDRLTVETGLRWEGWSSYDQLKIEFDQPVAGNTTSVTKKNWKDTWSMNLGAQYQLNDAIALRAGYLYGRSPIPDDTFDPSIPNGDTHLFTIGTGIDYKEFRIDLVYSYQKLEGRNKDNFVDDYPDDGALNNAASANGEYNSDLKMLGVSLTYKF